jgi:phosphatidylglycerol lysyltransferase
MPPGGDLAELLSRYGGAATVSLRASSCALWRPPGIDGAVGYSTLLRCATAIGDPLCARGDVAAMLAAFRAFCHSRGLALAWTATSTHVARAAIDGGCAAFAFGEELIVDPRRDPQAGGRGRELRKKVQRADRAGVSVEEYRRDHGRKPVMEEQMEAVAHAWQRARHGPQLYLSPVRLFTATRGVRWFLARAGGRVVGVLLIVAAPASGGVVFEHILPLPDAPVGTSERLVVGALATLGAEGCAAASFGPSPSSRLGEIVGLDGLSARAARALYAVIDRLVDFEARTRYRRKFQVDRSETCWVILDPPRIGPVAALGMLRAFHLLG